jgi:hypothetical protein
MTALSEAPLVRPAGARIPSPRLVAGLAVGIGWLGVFFAFRQMWAGIGLAVAATALAIVAVLDLLVHAPGGGSGPPGHPGLNRPGGALSFSSMRPSRLVSLLLAALVFLHGLALGAAPRGLPVASATAVSAGERQHSVPLPDHDETTCAICHGSVTLPALTLARTVIPDAPAMAVSGTRVTNYRLPRSASDRPPSSRAPPALRSA